MSTASPDTKAQRGTKRECLSCSVRFYDLGRESIVCPACGTAYVVVEPVVTEGRRPAPYAGKTGWRSKGFKAPDAVAPAAEAESDEPFEAVETEEDAAEETPGAPADDDVLEQDADDADVSDLIDHDIEEPKEP
jgi:uncharacterized protein (TIGR02300 family)